MAKASHPDFHRHANDSGTETISSNKPGQHPITFHKGGLHESLHVPQGEKIPQSKISAARAGKYGPKAKKEVQLMDNVLVGRK